eukprot:COSAG01_NODE_1243_length_11083_cov_7.565368_4_plen_67_part_00
MTVYLLLIQCEHHAFNSTFLLSFSPYLCHCLVYAQLQTMQRHVTRELIAGFKSTNGHLLPRKTIHS